MTIKEMYELMLSQGKHYKTHYTNVSDLLKESSYLLYEFKDSTDEVIFDDNSYDYFVKEKSPLYYTNVINDEANSELLDTLLEEVPFYHLTPSIYNDLDSISLSETRDIGINNVPSALQESDFYQTWFRDAFGYIQNLIILDVYNKLRYPYINENQYLDARIFSKLAKKAFNESVNPESRINFKDTDEENNEVYDSSYKYFGEEVGAIDYINDIIEKKIISNYCFIDFSSEQSNFLSNLISSLYESGQISYAETYSEKLIFKLQEIKNELLRRKLTGTYTLYKLALNSINRNGSFVSVIKASDANVETNDSLTGPISVNKNRPIRLLNTPGFITQTFNTIESGIEPIKAFYENPNENDKMPLRLLVPIYYTSADIKNALSVDDVIEFNNESFYTGGYTSPEDSTDYKPEEKAGYQGLLLRDNANYIQLDALESVISQDSITQYYQTLDQLKVDEFGHIVYRTLDDLVKVSDDIYENYTLDMFSSVVDIKSAYSNILDVNADHIMYHSNSVQQSLGVYYDYLTYPIADGNSVCLMDTFWLNYIGYQLENKTKVNDTTLIGTQVNTFIDLSKNESKHATYEFFGISYLGDDAEWPEGNDEDLEINSYKDFDDPSLIKYALLWYCIVTYSADKLNVIDVKKYLISKITLKQDAPSTFYLDGELKSEYKDCEIFTKYNIGVLPFTYKTLVNKHLFNVRLGFTNDNNFEDDAINQGYSKAMFVFSKYDLTSLASGKDTDPATLDKSDFIFTNNICDGIKTVYYVIKKTKKVEYKNTTSKSGDIKYDENGSIVETKYVDYFSWSDPIRVVELTSDNKLFSKNVSSKQIHFSPDWEGLCYYLNPYLNFTEKSASALRHNPVYKAYDNISHEISTKAPSKDLIKGTVEYYFDLRNIEDPENGDIYFVTKQEDYFIYDSKDDEWRVLNTRETIEGPSDIAGISNLTRTRRLDFAANDLGEPMPTYWVDPKYYSEYVSNLDHLSRSIYGLYLEKTQSDTIDRTSHFIISPDIYGDNRNRDEYDIQYTKVQYINTDIGETLPDLAEAEESVLYIESKTKEGNNSQTRYIFIKDKDESQLGKYIEVKDEDLKMRSSIYYSDTLKMPCLSMQTYEFNKYESGLTNTYKSGLKLSPCSDSNYLRKKIYVDSIDSVSRRFSQLTEKEKEYLFVTSNNIYYILNEDGTYTQVSSENYENEKEVYRAKKNWYWNKYSEDGLTVCFNLDIIGHDFYQKATGELSSDSTYYVKDENNNFYRKRPTFYPARIGSESLYKINYVQTDVSFEKATTTDFEDGINYYKRTGNSEPYNYELITDYTDYYGHVYTIENFEIAHQCVVCITSTQYYTLNTTYGTEHFGNYFYEKAESFDTDKTYYKADGYVEINDQDAVFNRKCEYFYKLNDITYKYIPSPHLYGTYVVLLNKDIYIKVNNELQKVEDSEQLSREVTYYLSDWSAYNPDSYFDKTDFYSLNEKASPRQTLISRYKEDVSKVNSEFSVKLEQIPGENACCIRFYFYPTGNSTEVWECTSKPINIEDLNNKNIRISASIFTKGRLASDKKTIKVIDDDNNIEEKLTNEVTMTVVVDSEITYKTFYVESNGTSYVFFKTENNENYFIKDESTSIILSEEDQLIGIPHKYVVNDGEEKNDDNSLGDIYLFSEVNNNNFQINSFLGNIYDFRLYNRGKSPEELFLLNLGTMRELYSYSPSVYKLAHSIYDDLSYLRLSNNTNEPLNNKKINYIRIFNRSVWDSICVDNFPVSTYEMSFLYPQYYEYYNNPKYDSDVYHYSINNGKSEYYLNDCIEQILLDRLEVFNGRAIEQNTLVKYGNSKDEDYKDLSEISLNKDDIVTAIFSTLLPIDYDNESINSGSLKYRINNNTIISGLYSTTDEIIIPLKADSSDDYFRYSADVSPNFLIDSDFDLSCWLSRGTNVSLTYDDNTKCSYATIADTSIKDSMANNILTSFALPKQPEELNNSVGYLDKFYISNFKLSESLIKLLRANSYYSELRIPMPCKRLVNDKILLSTPDNYVVEEIIPVYYKDEEGNKVIAKGYFEPDTDYYHYIDNAYVIAEDYNVTDEIPPLTYIKNNNNEYIIASGTYQSNVNYYAEAFVYKPSFYNKWDGIRVLKEGTYFVTCKYPIRLLPFNDDEFDSSSKLNYSTIYGSIRFKIEVTSSTKDMTIDEIEKYNINGIPRKYQSDKIISTLQNPSELVDPEDNKTFPHKEMHIKLYAMDTQPDSENVVDLAGYMKKVNNVYEEQYGFRWNLIASNDYLDCYTDSWSRPEEILSTNNYFIESDNTYELISGEEIINNYYELNDENWKHPTRIVRGQKYFEHINNDYVLREASTILNHYYEFKYKNNGVLYLNKEALDDGCVIDREVAMFMSKNYSLPFFIAGQEKTEDDESFNVNSLSADDDLIEPIKIRPNFNKFELTKDSTKGDENQSISNTDENLIANQVDDLDHIILVAGKSYKVLFDYTSKVSELAYTNNFYNEAIGSEEKAEYYKYYSLIDRLGNIDSNYQYTTDGNSYRMPSTYTDYTSGYKIEDTFRSVSVLPGKPIPVNTYFTQESNGYRTASGIFEENTTYYIRSSSNWSSPSEDRDNYKLTLGNPFGKTSSSNTLMSWVKSNTQKNIDNLSNSYKINYMSAIEEDIRNINDIDGTTYPILSIDIEDFKAYSFNSETVETLDNFSETDILKTLYNNLVNQDLAYNLQSSTNGAIGGFTTVTPHISYREVGDIKKKVDYTKYIEVNKDTHELYSYASSSRIMPYASTFNITRTSLFKNNLLKGKQLDYLNSNFWSITGNYGELSFVEDEDFGKSVLEATDVDTLNMMYDGGDYILNANYESAINIKDIENKIQSIKVYYYNGKNELLNKDGYTLVKNQSDSIVGNWSYESERLSASKIMFTIKTSEPCNLRIGKIIVRGNSTTTIKNGLANCYYDNSFVDQNIITVSHLIPVLKDIETEQYIPIRFKNGTIHAHGQVRPNMSLNIAANFISKNLLSGYGSKSKLSKLNTPWIRRFYYDHSGVGGADSLENEAYFHKYDVTMDTFNVKKVEEVFNEISDIFTFTPDNNGNINPSNCFSCTRKDENSMTLRVGNTIDSKVYGIDIKLDEDDTLSYFGNNMKINRNDPISMFNEKLKMTFNCFNLENYRNGVSSPTVITNVQLLSKNTESGYGTYDDKEIVYELEYLPIIYDELKHHISFNIMIKH